MNKPLVSLNKRHWVWFLFATTTVGAFYPNGIVWLRAINAMFAIIWGFILLVMYGWVEVEI